MTSKVMPSNNQNAIAPLSVVNKNNYVQISGVRKPMNRRILPRFIKPKISTPLIPALDTRPVFLSVVPSNYPVVLLPGLSPSININTMNVVQQNTSAGMSALNLKHCDVTSSSNDQKFSSNDTSVGLLYASQNSLLTETYRDLKIQKDVYGKYKSNEIEAIDDLSNTVYSNIRSEARNNVTSLNSTCTLTKESLKRISVSDGEITFTHKLNDQSPKTARPMKEEDERKKGTNLKIKAVKKRKLEDPNEKVEPIIIKFKSNCPKRKKYIVEPTDNVVNASMSNVFLSENHKSDDMIEEMISFILSKDTSVNSDRPMLNCQLLKQSKKVEEQDEVEEQATLNDNGSPLLREEYSKFIVPHIDKTTTWTCLQCSEIFSGSSPFAMHLKNHLLVYLGRRFICEVCNYRFKNYESFRVHMWIHEKGQQDSGSDANPIGIQSNEASHTDSFIVVKSKGPTYLQKAKTPKFAWKDNFNCQICGKKFSSGTVLLRHLSIHCRDFVCSFCQKGFSHIEDLDKHLGLCTQNKERESFQCTVCKKSFKKNALLKLHFLQHDETLKCGLCNQVFLCQDALKTHLSKCARKLVPKENREKDNPNLSCHFCHREFSSLFYLNNHVSFCKQFALLNEIGAVNCEQCGTLCQDRAQLRDHLQIHTHAFQCLGCKQRFRTRGTYEMHICGAEFSCDNCGNVLRSMHELFKHITAHGPPPYWCSACRYPYYKKENIQSHTCKMESNSENENDDQRKRIQCPFCPSEFVAEHNLKKHMASLHDIPIKQKFACAKCGKSFHRSDLLKAHVNVHLAPSHECLHCHKKFKSLQSFTNHSVLHTKDYRFRCKICDKGFIKKKNYTSHARTHSSE